MEENQIFDGAKLSVVVDDPAKLCEELGVSQVSCTDPCIASCLPTADFCVANVIQIDQGKEWPGIGTGTALMFHAYEVRWWGWWFGGVAD